MNMKRNTYIFLGAIAVACFSFLAGTFVQKTPDTGAAPYTGPTGTDPQAVAAPFCSGTENVARASLYFSFETDPHFDQRSAGISFRCKNGLEGRMTLQ
jgi:hypothetical protein